MKLALPAALAALLLLLGAAAVLLVQGRPASAPPAANGKRAIPATAPHPARADESAAAAAGTGVDPAAGSLTRRAPAIAARPGEDAPAPADEEAVPEALPLDRGDAALFFIITGAAGEPARSAAVTLLSGRTAGDAFTDAQGIASFLDLAPGTYGFRIRAEGLPEVAGAKELTVSPGERREVPVQLGDFRHSIAGRVLDRTGAPAPGIGVSARKHFFEAAENDVLRADPEAMEAMSGADGAYEITGLDEGDYLLSTRPTASFPAARRVYRSGTTSADIVLAATRVLALEGLVTSRQGAPVAGAAIRPLGQVAGETLSDGDGRYRTKVEIADGQTSHVVVATREGFRESRVHFRLEELGGADRWEVDIVLDPLGARADVRGRLVGPEGEPVPGETVYLQSPSLDARYTARSDEEGRFALKDVQVGKDYRLWIYPQSRFQDHSRTEFDVPEEGVDVEIQLEAADLGTLRGVLIDPEGRPVPRFTLWIRSMKALGRSLPLTSDAAGRFAVEGVPEGEILFETRSLPRFTVRGVRLAPGDEKELSLVLDWGPHAVAGSVTDERGAPVAGAQVSLYWAKSEGGAQSSSFRNAVTDASGRFSFSELAAGEHKVSVSSPDHAPAHAQYDVGSPAAAPAIVLKEKRR